MTSQQTASVTDSNRAIDDRLAKPDTDNTTAGGAADPFGQVGAFLGARASEAYTTRFRRIGRRHGFSLSFNWWAACLGPFWWSARQLWGYALVFWVLELNILARLGHGLFGDLGAEQAARAEQLMARSAARAEEAARALAAGEDGAERMARSAENLAKVANEAAAEAARLASDAPMLVLVSLGLLILVKGVQLVTADWALERKYMKWRARRASDARLHPSSVLIGCGLIATTYITTIAVRIVERVPEWLSGFPADPDWRNVSSTAIDALFDAITAGGGTVFDSITFAINRVVGALENFLTGTPWPVIVALVVVLAWRTAGVRTAIFTGAALAYLGLLGFWDKSLATVALLGTAALTSIVLGIPIGIWCARDARAYAVIRPVLDFMQTMPAFVYLIPVIALFGIGKPPAVIATLSFGMPPVIRLTALGLKSVPEDVREAAVAFGSTRLTVLLKVDLPMAAPSILTGINQTILMSLGMVVIASLIGAEGLGQDVLQALQFAATGYGILSGLAILFCAMILDRIVQGRIVVRS